jgi:CO dehydrogenase/acetyl-CoA synthase alpha subunit
VDDQRIRAMVTYVVKYFHTHCPENLETMVHLIGHDERFRKRVEEITEEIINYHDEFFVACSSGEKVEEITPKYAKQCKEIRSKMRKLVDEYLSEKPAS